MNKVNKVDKVVQFNTLSMFDRSLHFAIEHIYKVFISWLKPEMNTFVSMEDTSCKTKAGYCLIKMNNERMPMSESVHFNWLNHIRPLGSV